MSIISFAQSHAEPYGRTSPCVAEGVEHNKVRILGNIEPQRPLRREVGVSLVDHYNALKLFYHFDNLIAHDVVAGRIVGRAYPYELSGVAACMEQPVGCSLIILVKLNRAVFNIVDVGADFIHAVRRFYGHNVVSARACKAAIEQVDGLVGAVAEKNLLGPYAFLF